MIEENKDNNLELALKEPLIKTKHLDSLNIAQTPKEAKQHKSTFNFCQCFKSCMGFNSIQTTSRKIYFDGDCRPRNYFKNLVRNQKYNILSFIPLVLFNQFKYFFNLFFLIIGLSQFYEPLRVGFTFTYVAPLCFVISVTMIKEFFDDYERSQKDKEANSFVYSVLTKKGFEKRKASSLKVGDIVQINPNERIPADLILIYTQDESGTVFIRTDQLDGETDWKLRKPINEVHKYFQARRSEDFKEILGQDWTIEAGAPSGEIYKFEGIFKNRRDGTSESLGLEQTLWTNCVLASAMVCGMVIYTGKETRMQMNSQKPRTKMGKIDHSLNSLSKFLFLFLMFMSMIMVVLHGIDFRTTAPLLLFFRYILLLSSIIPISMRVNLDVAKIVYSRNIAKDPCIKGTIARNRVIPEELGLIRYLLSDKTGTLTKNDMIFKKLSLESEVFTLEQSDRIRRMLVRACRPEDQVQDSKTTNSMAATSNSMAAPPKPRKKKAEGRVSKNPEGSSSLAVSVAVRSKDQGPKSKNKDLLLKDVVYCMALCNNVTPIYSEGQKNFQASSPDEVALVIKAEDFGVKLKARTQTRITISNPIDQDEEYKILANFPFSSERKRMGIIVQNTSTNEIVFFLKGADIVMKDILMEVKRGYLLDKCDDLSKEGLRTLVLTQKKLSIEEFKEWEEKYLKAQNSMSKREEKVSEVIGILERNMTYLGVAGVEDRLQEDINKSIENLRNAGIKIWVLTGDKAETAKCIAISAGIKEANSEIFEMLNLSNQDDILNLIQKMSDMLRNKKIVLLIDGVTLSVVLENLSSPFFTVAKDVSAVICARCAPTQKAKITKLLKHASLNGQVAAIGDGGNDVGMIQEADVGVGIVGKEGMQAALASDFSIEQFKFLEGLALWHGRLSYKRSAALSQFVIHRGLIISVLQIIFTCSFYYVAIPIYNGWLMLGYSTIYTTLPVFSLIFDEDLERESAMAFPTLYNSLQNGRHLSIKTLLQWIWKSLYQGAVIFLSAVYLFDKVFLNIVTITFSSLILTEFLNVYTETNKITPAMLVSQFLSALIYFSSILFLNRIFNVSDFDLDFLWKMLVITFMSWAPLHFSKLLIRYLYPTDYEKVRQQAKNSRKKKSEGQIIV